MNAKISLRELKRKNVISDSLMLQIESAYSENAKEQLYDHLRHNADVATLRDYCKMLIAADGYPKMQKLGERMLYELPPTEGLFILSGVLQLSCACVVCDSAPCACDSTSICMHGL